MNVERMQDMKMREICLAEQPMPEIVQYIPLMFSVCTCLFFTLKPGARKVLQNRSK